MTVQGNIYVLKAASSMAVIDFVGACQRGVFWVMTLSFIVIAATGLLLNALAMRYYKATYCVCSFVGWYNVSAAVATAAFFGSELTPLQASRRRALVLCLRARVRRAPAGGGDISASRG